MPAELRNPFFHRQGISSPANFFGRGDLVRSLFEMIASGQSCAVVGERRIGKSSLLSHLADSWVQEHNGLEGAATLTVFLDFQALSTCSPAELFREVLEAMALDATDERVEKTVRAALDGHDQGFSGLRKCVRQLWRTGCRTVILCDEFELAVQNPNLDEGFFGGLRSLAGNEGVVFVTASRLGLLELEQYRSEEARQKVLASPFFNIFAEFAMGPFLDYELAELIACSLASTPVRFDDDDVELLGRIAGRHPYFVQLAAYHFYRVFMQSRRGQQPLNRAAIHHEVIEGVRRESQKIFRNQWLHSQEVEKRALVTLVGAGQGIAAIRISEDTRVLTKLCGRGLVLESRDSGQDGGSTSERSRRYRIFSNLFEEWLRDSVSISMEGDLPVSTAGQTPPSRLALVVPSDGASRYEVLEEIGRGGSGTVHKAWDERLDRVVAIKIFNREIRSSPEVMSRLIREARTCASLNHANIVVIHDIDVVNGHLVQEFLAGGSLLDLLEMPGGRLNKSNVVRLARQIASALAAAHEAGVVHRDIKPANVLLGQRPRLAQGPLPDVKLVDFGTAVRLDENEGLDGQRRFAGTLAYMAPEQLRGERVGPPADIYSFGVLLFEAWHGRRPSFDETGAGSYAKHIADTVDTPLGAIINRCLAPSPGDRYLNGEELFQALGHVVESR